MSGNYTCRQTEAAWRDGTTVAAVELACAESGLAAIVVPRAAGELCSLTVRRDGVRLRAPGRDDASSERLELLYRAMEFGPPPSESDGWRGRAPLLWPLVGRNWVEADIERARATGVEPPSSSYLLDGTRRHIPGHGFAKDLPWELAGSGADAESAWVVCRLESSGVTYAMYPFRFSLTVTHALRAGAVTSRYVVRAGDNATPMPFSIGNHISFNFPFSPSSRYEDGVLTASNEGYAELDKLNLFSGRRLPKSLKAGVALADPMLSNLVLCGFRPEAQWIELRDPAGGPSETSGPSGMGGPSETCLGIRVEQREIGARRFEPDQVYFTLWGSPTLRYFCPEPWLGGPNSLNTGKGLARLRAGGTFEWAMTTTVLSDA